MNESRIITIDRTMPFDPVKLLREGWTIAEQDDRSLALTQVDLAKVQLEHVIKRGEKRIGGEERLERLKNAGYIRLNAKVFQILWEDQNLIPESWNKKIRGNIRYLFRYIFFRGNIRYIFFDGTVLQGPNGHRYILCLYRRDGRCYWDYGWLEGGWCVNYLSAVLAI